MTILLFMFGMLIAIGMSIGSFLLLFVSWKRKKENSGEDLKRLTFRQFWWDYYKELAAVPTGWIIVHIIIFLVFTEPFKAILEFKFNWFLSLQLSVFILNSILNKNTPFKERFSRASLSMFYSSVVIMFIAAMVIWPWHGELLAKWNKNLASRVRIVVAAELSSDIQVQSRKQTTDSEIEKLKQLKEDLKKIKEKVNKGKLTKLEAEGQRVKILSEQEKLLAIVKKNNPISDRSNGNGNEDKDIAPPPPRHLSGIYKVPQGETIKLDTSGKEIKYLKCERIYAEVIIGYYKNVLWNNQNLPSFRFKKRRIIVYGRGPRRINTIELTNIGKKDNVFVEIKVVPLRCA